MLVYHMKNTLKLPVRLNCHFFYFFGSVIDGFNCIPASMIYNNIRFTDIDKENIDFHVNSGWCTRIIAREHDWEKSSVREFVMEYNKTEKFETKIRQSYRRRNKSLSTDRSIRRSILATTTKHNKGSNDV